MKKILFLMMFMPTCIFAQSWAWYTASGKKLPVDSIGNGSVNAVQKFTGLDYLQDYIYTIYKGSLLLYKPLSHQPLFVSAKSLELARNEFKHFKLAKYDDFNFESDFNALKKEHNPDTAAIRKYFGSPDDIVTTSDATATRFIYSRYNFSLDFLNGNLLNYHRTIDMTYGGLQKRFGPVMGKKVFFRHVAIGMTPEMVTAILGDPDNVSRTTTAAGTSEVWTYTDENSYYLFKNGKVTLIHD